MSKTSRFWPYIRAIGKALTIPGTKIGPGILVEIQDKLSADEAQRQLSDVLDEIRQNTAHIAASLREEGIDVSAQGLAEACYLKRTADDYLYADFKGIEASVMLSPGGCCFHPRDSNQVAGSRSDGACHEGVNG